MIRLIYDAYEGKAFRDGDVHRVVEDIIVRAGNGDNIEVVFATDNFLNAMRVAIVHKRIDVDSVQLLCRRRVANLYVHDNNQDNTGGKIIEEVDFFGDEQPERLLRIYPSGGISPWPKGFCDRTEFYLMELL